MNKANFTFFHSKGTGKLGIRVATSMFLFFSLFLSLNVSAQTVSCNGTLNVSVNPGTCQAIITPNIVGQVVGGQGYTEVVKLTGISSSYTENLILPNGNTAVIVYADEIPAFLSTGMVMGITYTLQATVNGQVSNSCWGTLVLEDKAAPTIVCADPIRMSCADYDPVDSWPDPVVTECTAYGPLAVGQYKYNEACVEETIIRDYTVTDAKGNKASCSQSIVLTPETLENLSLPDNYHGIGDITVNYGGADITVYDAGYLSCDGGGTEWNVDPVTGYPSPADYVDTKGTTSTSDDVTIYGTGYPGGIGTCGTIAATYSDLKIEVCNDPVCAQSSPSFKIIRKWTILNWCTGAVLEHNQIIKVIDTEAPTAEGIADVTISTDLWGCGATYKIPVDPTLKDNCSTKIKTTHEAYIGADVNGNHIGTIVNGVLTIPSGVKQVFVYSDYEDCCGNSTTGYYHIVTVVDQVPPVVVADAHTVVSLSQYNSNGLAKVFASTFDDGSFDGCGPIALSVRRMSTTCPGYAIEDGDDPATTADDKWWGDYVHFCCEDVQIDEAGKPIPVMVVFRVCDDANGDGIPGGSGDLCNTAMVEVEVQDKLPPACAAPNDREINCIDAVAYQDLINAGPLSEADAAKVDAAFGDAHGAATCNVEVVQQLSSEEDCGEGLVTRTITVTNIINKKSVTCTQKIYIYAKQNNFLTCDDITFPEGSAEDVLYRAYIKKNYTDKKDLRFAPNLVWCLMNPYGIGDLLDDGENLPAIKVADCGGVTITPPKINIDNLCSEVGINLSVDTFDFAGGGCKKILAHWEIIDQCKFVENYLYYNESTGKHEINPFVPENGYFEMYVEYDIFDTVKPVIECGEGQIVGCGETFAGPITATATDNCTDPAFFGWNWKLTFEGETKVYSGEGNSILPGNIKVDGVALTAFPAGTHSVTWIVSDGCGNTATKVCTFGLAEEDDKAPTPYCYDGLSSAVMLMNGVTLWASDFDAGSYDNCGGDDVTVTMVPESDVEGLSAEDAYDAATASWNFTCEYIANGVAATIDVRIYATDASGNYDYCTASFRLQDNLGGCPDSEGSLSAIGGNIATESGVKVNNVEVEAMTTNPEFPKYTKTGADGKYAFYSNPTFYNYEITSSKNDDFTNGVSTLDLVIIQKHILSIEALNSPYKRIAADINNDGSIKASDLLQLRKLILGLYTGDRLPSNDSWRFVDADFQFADAANPWPFDEIGNVDNLSTNMMAENFIGVKVGDVNGTVQGSANSNAVVRTNKAVTLELNNASYAAGEVVELNFTSADFNQVYGYQFTLEFSKDLTFTGIDAGALNVTEANFGLNRISEGVITTSYDNVRGETVAADAVLFTVRFTANNNTNVKDAVAISSKKTAAEAYVGAGLEVNNVNLAFRTNEGTEIAETYALFQNEPNPFRGSTVINFNLPEAANATLAIYDVTGKVLYSTTASYAKGMNSVKVENLNASGVLYYQLDSNDFTATKKMIVID